MTEKRVYSIQHVSIIAYSVHAFWQGRKVCIFKIVRGKEWRMFLVSILVFSSAKLAKALLLLKHDTVKKHTHFREDGTQTAAILLKGFVQFGSNCQSTMQNYHLALGEQSYQPSF